MQKIITIKATNLPDVWFQTLYKIIEVGRDFKIDQGSFSGQLRKEFDFITIHAKCPGVGELLPKLNPALNIPDPVEEEYLNDYLPYLMTGEEKEGESYTYGQRICRASTRMHNFVKDPNVFIKGSFTEEIMGIDMNTMDGWLNQMELMIWTYKNKGHRNNQMILQVGQPSDMLLLDPPCVITNTQILTITGKKNAQDIKIGDVVFTHNGNWKKIKKVFKRKYSGKLNTIVTERFKARLSVTPEHPINVQEVAFCPYDKKQKMICKPNCKKQYSSYEKHGKKCKKVYEEYRDEWINASKLNNCHFVKIPKIKGQETYKNTSSDLFWLYGIWLAEGDYSDGLRFNLGDHEKGNYALLKIQKIMFNEFELTGGKIYREDNSIRQTYYSKELENIFYGMFKKYARYKEMPFDFVFASNNKLQSLIDGFVCGDGYIRQRGNTKSQTISFYTTSKLLKDSFINILLKLGYVPTVSVSAPKNGIINGRIIKSNGNGYAFSYVIDQEKTQKMWKTEEFIYIPIKENSILEYDGFVYNYEVEGDNSYIADGFPVHNCLRHIDTRIQDGKLNFYPYFRSWDLWGGLPANLAAIELMKQYMANEIGVENGEIIATSKGCHIYSYIFEMAEIVRGKTCKEFKQELSNK